MIYIALIRYKNVLPNIKINLVSDVKLYNRAGHRSFVMFQ